MEDTTLNKNTPITSTETTQPPVMQNNSETQPQNIQNILLTEKQLETILRSAHENLAKNSFEEALNSLEEGCKAAEASFGESSYESAILHFELGSALLQKVETSRDVFGDAIKAEKNGQENAEGEVQDNDQTEETKEESQNVGTSQAQENPQTQEIVTSKENEIDKRDLVEISEEQDSKETEATFAQDQSGQMPIEEKQAQEEEVDDLQVAWEQMEVARVFLEKLVSSFDATNPDVEEEKLARHNKIMKTLAHCMLRLADANCFRENFDAALQDYEKCLNIRKTTEDNFFSRDLAEIYYSIGNVHLYKNDDTCDDVALSHFNKARIILENLLYKYMNSSSVKDPEDLTNHQHFMSREYLKPSVFETEKIKEIKEILTDLYNKIEDTKEQKKERARVAQEIAKVKQMAESTANLEASFSKPLIQPQQPNDSNPEGKPAPKIVHLGTFGAARKRTREEMEKSNIPFINPGNGSQGVNANGQANNENVSQDTQNPNVSGKPTQVDEQGHVEKMTKI